jgi:hypothetical protein
MPNTIGGLVGNVYLKLNGPGSEKPKAPAAYGWQSPGFQGLGKLQLARILEAGGWVGMRTDQYVVIDCDDAEAKRWWLDVLANHDVHGRTWERKTPHGYHFIYQRTPTSPEASLIRPIKGVNLDVLAGTGRQIVLWADGYVPVTESVATQCFNEAWLPASAFERKDFSDDEWDEMPEGRGNDTLAAVGGVLRRYGASYEVILRVLAGINKLTMTTDPMPIEEVARVAQSVCRYSPADMQPIILTEDS